MSKRENFLMSLSNDELADFFGTLSESEQCELFEEVTDHDCDAFYYPFDEDSINEVFPSAFAAMQATQFGNVHWSDRYFHLDGRGNIETFSDLSDYMSEYIAEMRFALIADFSDEICEYFEFEDDEEGDDE